MLNPVALTLLLAGAASFTAEQIDQKIELRGPRAVLADIYDQPAVWEPLFEGICEGQPAWLKVAVRLRLVSDAGASEDLNQALAEAMLHVPHEILRILAASPDGGSGRFRTEFVCGNFEVLHRRGLPSEREDVLRWLARQEAAVRKVKDDELQVVANACTRSIGGARESARDRCFGLTSKDCRSQRK